MESSYKRYGAANALPAPASFKVLKCSNVLKYSFVLFTYRHLAGLFQAVPGGVLGRGVVDFRIA